MKLRTRLYPTVREERERKVLKSKLGLTRTAIAKGGGMPNPKSQEKVGAKERRVVTDLTGVNRN